MEKSQHGIGAGPADAAGVRPVDLRDYVRFEGGGATRVRVFATDVLTLDLWCIQPQQATQVLMHPDVDVSYTVIGGRAWFVTDQGEVGLDPLGALLVPAGVAHGIDNRGPDPLIVQASAAPPDVALDDLREDQPTASEGQAVREDEQPSPVHSLLRGLLRRARGGS